jgi:Myb-like DNA-binding domain
MGKGKRWNETEARILNSMTSDVGDRDISAANWKRISDSIPGRSPSACQAQYYSTNGSEGSRISSGSRVPVSQQQEQDRQERATARQARDEDEMMRGIVTSAFFGDPPPRYSALDRKMAGA